MTRTAAEEDELAELIRQQADDDTPYQRPQPGTQPYGLLIDLVNEDGRFVDGRFGKPRVERSRYGKACPVHGNSNVVRDPGGTLRCRPCKAEYARAARRRKGR